MTHILLVRVPVQEFVDGRKLRDYILESLARGVLVLTEDASCEVMELPMLGGIELEPEWKLLAPPPLEPEAPVSTSSDAAVKRAILQRLSDYRKENGLGCLEKVAEKTAHFKADRLSVETLRMIITGDAPKIDMAE